MFQGAVDATFGHLGVDATYLPEGGSAIDVRVIFREPAETAGLLGTGLDAPAHMAELRVSEVATPAVGDQLAVDGRNYVVRQARQDALGLVWRLDLDPA